MAGCTSKLVSFKMRGVLLIRVMALCQHRGDLDGYGTIVGIIHGSGEIPLSVVRPCGMGVTPRKALDMYESPHLTILYLLRGE